MIKVLVYCASGAGERVAYTLDEKETPISIVPIVDRCLSVIVTK